MTRLDELAEIFIITVDTLLLIHRDKGNTIFETNKGKAISIRPKNFKYLLSKQCPDVDPKTLLASFRKLHFIITDHSGKSNTNIVYLNNKSKRMISIDKEFYAELKEVFNSKKA